MARDTTSVPWITAVLDGLSTATRRARRWSFEHEPLEPLLKRDRITRLAPHRHQRGSRLKRAQTARHLVPPQRISRPPRNAKPDTRKLMQVRAPVVDLARLLPRCVDEHEVSGGRLLRCLLAHARPAQRDGRRGDLQQQPRIGRRSLPYNGDRARTEYLLHEATRVTPFRALGAVSEQEQPHVIRDTT